MLHSTAKICGVLFPRFFSARREFVTNIRTIGSFSHPLGPIGEKIALYRPMYLCLEVLSYSFGSEYIGGNTKVFAIYPENIIGPF